MNRLQKIIVWFIFIYVLSFSSLHAQAVKYIKLTPKNNLSLTYDDTQETSGNVIAQLSNDKGTTDLNYYVTFDPIPGNRFFTNGNYSIPFEIYDTLQVPRRILFDAITATSSDQVLVGIFPTPAFNKAPSDTKTFVIVVPPGGFVPAGTYSATLTTHFWEGTFKSGIEKGQAQLSLKLSVNDILNVVAVPVGANFDFSATQMTTDFGYLEIGAMRSFDLIARANTTYGLSITSTNGGYLRNNDPGDSSSIPYTLQINGSSVSLPAGVSVPIVSAKPATNAEGDRYTITAKILNYDFPTEGLYSDTLVITIAKN
jgi:spore coat protein U-like protein